MIYKDNTIVYKSLVWEGDTCYHITVTIDYYVFTKPFARARCDTKSTFQRSLTGLNLEFSFSHTGCYTKVKEPSLPTIYS